ncbi:uncharacterized protein K444DRAFT_642763 [Hyaloscypha bicolor E]|uniref:Uncharacterized protein n=1 Tax=Hyaloscypha bicolor E TaxID=1095630 RepID=A0A2J6TCT7_9HELO|nr:uncharacterized protein K444DRAFT_642763 [Hyaloscypha bicolor E]PMD60847.1 hypothetical protein K444DRAFT_642763 [Hyaloscypha bicolor E]
MRQRDFCTLGLGLGSLLFSILTLVAGCRKGTLNDYAIAAYSYDLTDGVVYPPLNSTNSSIPYDVGPYAGLIGDDTHWRFFTVHFLSICGGYVGGTEDPEYGFLKWERRAAGWRFRTDDPFIVNFLSFDGRFPVNSTVPWIHHFEAVAWTAVAFIYVAFIWKLSDFMFQKEKRRRLLTTGQI